MKKYGAVWLILLAAAISVIAGLLPLFRGGTVNATLVALGAFWFIVAIAVSAKTRKRSAQHPR